MLDPMPPPSPYPLITPRLRIAPLAERDLARFVAYRRDLSVARWQSWEPSFSEPDARALLAAQPSTALPAPGQWLQLAAHLADDATLCGDVAVLRVAGQPDTFELGVTLAPAAQGQGLGAEAVARVLAFLFAEGQAHRVVASCDARNAPVARLLSRVGMRHESRQIDADFFKGEWTTLDGYAVLAREHAQPGLPGLAGAGRS